MTTISSVTMQENKTPLNPIISQTNKPAGLTYGKAIQNITKQVQRTSSKIEDAATTAGMVIGIAAAIAGFVACCVVAGCLISSCPLLTVGMYALACCLPGIGVLAAGVVGSISGIATNAIIHISKKIWENVGEHNRMFEGCDTNAKIENEDLLRALEYCDENLQKSMLQEMDNNQLLTAKTTVDPNIFAEFYLGHPL